MGYHDNSQVEHTQIPQLSPKVSPPGPNTQDNMTNDHVSVMQKQNAITELLVKQQQLTQLPIKDIPVFKGDALQYKAFIRAFEHAVEQKTDNDQDKLYFLEQFTAGEPQELIRSVHT